jgi:hypothetical protein
MSCARQLQPSVRRIAGGTLGLVLWATTALAANGDIVPIDIAAGQGHACVLMSDGQVYCWGAVLPALEVSVPSAWTVYPASAR